jgi:hypothetical protein
MKAFKVFLKYFCISFCVSFTIWTTIVLTVNGESLTAKGIYPHKSNAVYIQNDRCVINRKEGSFEACYIDMAQSEEEMIESFNLCLAFYTEEDDRSAQDLSSDFAFCLNTHREVNAK